MASTTPKIAFLRGFRDGSPFFLVLAPFAGLFGVVATEAGLNVFETLVFSIAVIAGTAQFAALQLMSENAPTAIVIASALAVNLRMAMYSASLAPHFAGAPLWQKALAAYATVDQSAALSLILYDQEPEMSRASKMAYFFGVISVAMPTWYCFTLIGALGGKAVPESWALDFALPITFLAMIGPMLRTPAHMAAAFVSVVGALAFGGIPFNMGLLIAAILAMLTGAQVELWLSKKVQADG
ncbi:AzlC family ABC transporter permease [Cognatishimia activa]|uniref:Inner membrane protein YgaZ n=1 Tax=Cognatishimia activa TaxID=1715691 RepID=A0A0P1IR73_9RHOB|nr:AzlC family ABC transporter permease [Cognatishimia activa]CUJ04169.1 Inner membrane protein YgaZ [Cognatishimia activa]CUK26082.1 Inner membrane protein YgaZ [Cognatishimia activa]